MTTEVIAVSAAASASTPTTPYGVFHVISTVNCHILIASTGNATTSDFYLPAEKEGYFSIGNLGRVSFIKAVGASDGLAYVTRTNFS